MNYAKLSVALLLPFAFSIKAMDGSNSDNDRKNEGKSHPRPAIVIGVLGSNSNPALLADLFMFMRDEQPDAKAAVEAAENCDLVALRERVNETNSNTVSNELSLLSLALKKQINQQTFDRSVPDYLISKGAYIDRRANPSREMYCPLALSVGLAIYHSNFSPLEYLLEKNGNPFLTNQTHQGLNAARLTAKAESTKLSEAENKARVMALLPAQRISMRLSTLMILQLLANL